MKITNLAEDSEDFTGNVWSVENKGEKTLVDVGAGDCWKEIEKLDSVDKVIMTHTHRDHVENMEKVSEKLDPEIYSFNPENPDVNSSELEESEKIMFSGMEFDIIHTPGHKDDSICLYNPENKVLFTGDLIFPEGSFGRTDLEEGDREKLIESIKKITELEVEEFYPGHGNPVEEDADKCIAKSLENAEKREVKYQ